MIKQMVGDYPATLNCYSTVDIATHAMWCTYVTHTPYHTPYQSMYTHAMWCTYVTHTPYHTSYQSMYTHAIYVVYIRYMHARTPFNRDVALPHNTAGN